MTNSTGIYEKQARIRVWDQKLDPKIVFLFRKVTCFDSPTSAKLANARLLERYFDLRSLVLHDLPHDLLHQNLVVHGFFHVDHVGFLALKKHTPEITDSNIKSLRYYSQSLLCPKRPHESRCDVRTYPRCPPIR